MPPVTPIVSINPQPGQPSFVQKTQAPLPAQQPPPPITSQVFTYTAGQEKPLIVRNKYTGQIRAVYGQSAQRSLDIGTWQPYSGQVYWRATTPAERQADIVAAGREKIQTGLEQAAISYSAGQPVSQFYQRGFELPTSTLFTRTTTTAPVPAPTPQPTYPTQPAQGIPMELYRPSLYVGSTPTSIQPFQSYSTERIISPASMSFYTGSQRVSGYIGKIESYTDVAAKRFYDAVSSPYKPIYKGVYQLGRGVIFEAPKTTVEMIGMIPGGVETIRKTPALLPTFAISGTSQMISSTVASFKEKPLETIGTTIGTAAIFSGVGRGIEAKIPAVVKFSESIVSTQKPILKSFIASEEASLFKPTEAQRIALEKGSAPIWERGSMAIRFGSKGYRPTGTPKPESGLISEYMGKKTIAPTVISEPIIKKSAFSGEDWVAKRNKEFAESLKGLPEPIVRIREEPLSMVKVKTETIPSTRKLTMVQERPVVLESIKGLKTFEEKWFVSKEAQESYLKGIGVLPISVASYREKQADLPKPRISKSVFPSFMPSRTTQTTITISPSLSITPSQAVSEFTFIQPKVEARLEPQLRPLTRQQISTDVLVREKLKFQFPSTPSTEMLFRKRKRKTIKGFGKFPELARIATARQIIGGVPNLKFKAPRMSYKPPKRAISMKLPSFKLASLTKPRKRKSKRRRR